jgi:hypothetical protein
MKKTAVLSALEQFVDGPKILGCLRSRDWNIKHPKTMKYESASKKYNGKRYQVVWISSITSSKIQIDELLESVDGGPLHELSEKGKCLLGLME